MSPRDLPNLISVLRMLLVAPLAWLLLAREYQAVLWLYALAALSDALDGHLARRYGWVSHLGSILDPIGDKLLLAASYLCLAWLGLLPPWLALAVVVRDVVIVTGAAVYYLLIDRAGMTPTWLSKLNTVAQIVLPLLVLFQAAGMPVEPGWIQGWTCLVAATTFISGGHYVWVWGRRAWRASHAR